MTKKRARQRRYNMIVAAKRLRRRMRAKRKTVRLAARFRSDARLHQHVVQVEAPGVFSLARIPENRTRLLLFIDRIWSALKAGERVFIQFGRTRKMYADGTLLFYAELSMMVGEFGAKQIRCSYPKSRIVEQVLQQIGVFALLGKRERLIVDHETVRHWKSATGVHVEGHQLEDVQHFYKMAAPLSNSELYDGLVEAMTNCRHHAYPDQGFGTGIDVGGPWWMFWQAVRGELWVAFCDLGIGIPSSLRSGKRWETRIVDMLLSRLGLRGTDASLLKAAFEIGEKGTRTKEAHRGKGLQSLKDVIERGDGDLRVYSGYGFFEYRSGGRPERLLDFNDPIRGTLISWRLKLPAGTDQ